MFWENFLLGFIAMIVFLVAMGFMDDDKSDVDKKDY